MPYKIAKNQGKCKGDKPFAVVNKDSGRVMGCHPTRSKATAQLRALYTHVEGGEPLRFGYWLDLTTVKLDEGWIQAAPYGSYYHPIFGEIVFDEERLGRMRDNVNNGVRGQDLDIDYDHKKGAEGGKAAGWVKEAELRESGLWLKVDFTDDATEGIKKKEWRYFSPDFLTEWEHPKTQEKYEDVLCGGALTNRPFLKDILPINLSEIGYEFDEDTPRDGRALTMTQVNYRDSGDEAFRCDTCQRFIPDKRQNGAGCSRVAGEVRAEGVCDIWQSNEYYWFDEATGMEGVFRMTEGEKEDEGTGTGNGDKNGGKGNGGTQPAPTPTPASTPAVPEGTQLSETAVRQLYERIATLETANRTYAINTKLAEMTRIPPAVHDSLRSTLLQMSDTQATTIYAVLEQINKTGLIELGERGTTGTGGTEGSGGSATDRFNAAVAKLMSENTNIDYGTAVEQVARNNVQLFEEYRGESYLRDPSAIRDR